MESKTRKLLTEFVAFSDMHAHSFKYGSTRKFFEGHRYNSRLIDAVEVLRQISSYCREHKVQNILFGGDLFHERAVIHTSDYNLIITELGLEMADFNIIMIPGNHDYADRVGTQHSLHTLRFYSHISILDKLATSTVAFLDNDVAVHGVPYTDDLDQAKGLLKLAGSAADGYRYNVLLAHLGMQGAKVGSDYVLVSPYDIGVTDVPYEKFDICLFGHYHQHQQLFDNGWFIGATHQHNWGDTGTVRGFLHVKIYNDGIEFTQIPTKSPRFILVQGNEELPTGLRQCDFIRLVNHPSGGIDSKNALEERLDTCLDHVEIITPPTRAAEELRLDITSLEPNGLVEGWVNSQVDSSQEELRKALTLLGKELLGKASEEVS